MTAPEDPFRSPTPGAQPPGRDPAGRVIPSIEASQLALVVKDPVGPVGCIVPWNYPLLLLAWKLAPALAAGNATVCKPSEVTPLSTLALAACFDHLPAGVVNVVAGAGDVGASIVGDEQIECVAFTGSVAVLASRDGDQVVLADIVAGKSADGEPIRLGGMVEKGSLKQSDGTSVAFVVSDGAAKVPVTYRGILPDLFREGSGMVAEGRMAKGTFVADMILAKHDERYMPPQMGNQAAELMTRETAK